MSKYYERPDLLEIGKKLFGSDLVQVLQEDGYDESVPYEGGISLGTASTMRFGFVGGRAFEIGISEWGSIVPVYLEFEPL